MAKSDYGLGDGRGPYTGAWYDERNERRKKRYHNDPDYRSTANKSAREGYRKTAGVREPFDPRQNIGMLEPGEGCAGTMRALSHIPDAGPVLTFTKAELALIFNRPTKQIQQWAADGRIPSPMVRGRSTAERTWTEVYTQAEARAIVDALGEFLSQLIYFRTDHREVIDACRAAVTKVRKATFVGGKK